MSTVAAPPHRRPRPVRDAAQYFLFLVPLGAVVNIYLLITDSVTISRRNELVSSAFGRPFAWVEQDLSRYDPIAYPATIDFEFQRAWHDPVVTTYDGWLFAANTVILTTALTLLVLGLVAVVKRVRVERRRSMES
ncbi:hypothetical protein ACFWHT_02675 [Microbacterium sp. NPDC058342]|uniref:hypothetical protein n=1 Tax=Microbacterium sp. NPDC058342 TaxID=3346454 RepID=UPI0036589E45